MHAKAYTHLVSRVAALLKERTGGQGAQFAAAFKSLFLRMATVTTKLDNATVAVIVSSSLLALCVRTILCLQGSKDVAEDGSCMVADAFAVALLESIAAGTAPVMRRDDAVEALEMIHCRYLCPVQSNWANGAHLGCGTASFWFIVWTLLVAVLLHAAYAKRSRSHTA